MMARPGWPTLLVAALLRCGLAPTPSPAQSPTPTPTPASTPSIPASAVSPAIERVLKPSGRRGPAAPDPGLAPLPPGVDGLPGDRALHEAGRARGADAADPAPRRPRRHARRDAEARPGRRQPADADSADDALAVAVRDEPAAQARA